METTSPSSKRLPPFGKALAERLKWNNPPCFVQILIGETSWQQAKLWNSKNPDIPAMVVPSDSSIYAFTWPVHSCDVLLRKSAGPTDEQILELSKLLLRQGANIVTVVDDCTCKILAKYQAQC